MNEGRSPYTEASSRASNAPGLLQQAGGAIVVRLVSARSKG